MTAKEKIKAIKRISKLENEIKHCKGYIRLFNDIISEANKELVDLKYKLNLDK